MIDRIPVAGRRFLILAAATALLSSPAGGSDASKERRVEPLSPIYMLEKKYASMQGPSHTQRVELSDSEEPELLWITGFGARMVGEDGETPQSQEFMCHSNLDVNGDRHRQLLGLPPRIHPNRVFTISQGQYDIHFPDGFGLPVASNEPISLTTQVLNHNIDAADLEKPLKVRHKLAIDFVRDSDLPAGLRPLYQAQIYVVVSIDGYNAYVGTLRPTDEQKGSSCLPGEPAMPQSKNKHLIRDSIGQSFTSHWVVEPGRSVNHTLVTEPLDLKIDTTIHYIAVHLHPFAESLELRDLTAGKTLFKSQARNLDGKIGLEHVDSYSSEEGIPVFADHEYELVSVYDNSSGKPQDSMAVMYIYMLDKQFDREQVRLGQMP